MSSYSHDLFVSHASEDKDRFVRPLAKALSDLGLTAWYDEWELVVGDPLVDKINEGLRRSRFGVVVLSPAFFAKNWSRAELQALASLEMKEGRHVLLPVWLDIGTDGIAEHAPLLLGRVALKASDGIEFVASKLAARVKGDAEPVPSESASRDQELYPSAIQSQALPNSYSTPIDTQESGFVFRTIAALSLDLSSDQHLSSQQKRAFEAISADCSIEHLVGTLVGRPRLQPPARWQQTYPSSSTIVTIARPATTLAITGGTVEARTGLSLRIYPVGATYAIVHADVVFKPQGELRAGSLLSLEDFYNLLLVPGLALRTELAPVVGATLSGEDKPRLIAQSVVALPNHNDFSTYLNLSPFARDRAQDAIGPFGVHWNGKSLSELETLAAWKHTVATMIDRLFSDGGYLDYEDAIQRLDGSDLIGGHSRQ